MFNAENDSYRDVTEVVHQKKVHLPVSPSLSAAATEAPALTKAKIASELPEVGDESLLGGAST